MKLEAEALLYFVLKVTCKTHHCTAWSLAGQLAPKKGAGAWELTNNNYLKMYLRGGAGILS